MTLPLPNRLSLAAASVFICLTLACQSAASPPPAAPTSPPAPTAAPAPPQAPAVAPSALAQPAPTTAPAAPVPTTAAASTSILFGAPALDMTAFFIQVAQDKGFFQQHGLDVQLEEMKPPTIIAGMQTGEVEFTNSTGSSAQAAINGLPVRIIAFIQSEPFSFVSRPPIKTFDQLRDGKVGYNTPSGDDMTYIKASFATSALTTDDVEMLTVGPTTAIVQALLANQIDAGVVAPPFTQQLVAQGYNVLTGPEIVELPSSGLATSTRLLSDNPQLVSTTLQSLLDSIVWIKANRTASMQYLVDKYAVPSDIAGPAYDQLVAQYRFHFTTDQLQGVLDRNVAAANVDHPVSLSDVFSMDEFNQAVAQRGL